MRVTCKFIFKLILGREHLMPGEKQIPVYLDGGINYCTFRLSACPCYLADTTLHLKRVCVYIYIIYIFLLAVLTDQLKIRKKT